MVGCGGGEGGGGHGIRAGVFIRSNMVYFPKFTDNISNACLGDSIDIFRRTRN